MRLRCGLDELNVWMQEFSVLNKGLCLAQVAQENRRIEARFPASESQLECVLTMAVCEPKCKTASRSKS